jgi:GNAT superfamily N-acetyltransferase
MTTSLRIVPANEARWEDLQALFGVRGASSRCWCQRFKLARGESFGNTPAEERAWRLRQQTACNDPASETTSGLVAYVDDVPAGWCAVEPRSTYDGLRRVFKVPWEGRRDEDRADPTVWAVTCVLVRAGYRRGGLSHELVAATVPYARDRGARALEGYPITTTNVIPEELHVGTVAAFEAAGFRVVSRPTLRRAVLRIDF